MSKDRESVWDYPRPPRVEPCTERLRVVLGGIVIADSLAGFRVLETSHPPTYYLPKADFVPGTLQPHPRRTVCEWKGEASYWTLQAGGQKAEAAAWSYENPTPGFAAIGGCVAVYADRVNACFVGEEQVTPQGGFYGGWITSRIDGPFKQG